MKTKHTQGKWTVRSFWNKKIRPCVIISTENGHIEMNYEKWVKNKTEAEANGLLISYAPKLLESLNNMLIIAETENWNESTTGRQIIFNESRKTLIKAIHGDDVCFMDERTKENRHEWILRLNRSGYAGLNRDGMICDRREFPDAVPIKSNTSFKIANPKEL